MVSVLIQYFTLHPGWDKLKALVTMKLRHIIDILVLCNAARRVNNAKRVVQSMNTNNIRCLVQQTERVRRSDDDARRQSMMMVG